MLGKILRVDVDSPSDGKNYGVPADNPFVGQDGAAPEIYAYGTFCCRSAQRSDTRLVSAPGVIPSVITASRLVRTLYQVVVARPDC